MPLPHNSVIKIARPQGTNEVDQPRSCWIGGRATFTIAIIEHDHELRRARQGEDDSFCWCVPWLP